MVNRLQKIMAPDAVSIAYVRFSMGCSRLQHSVPQAKSLNVQVHYKVCANGLHMRADSTDIKFLGENEWKTRNQGAERLHWRKVHLRIDGQTMQIRAIAVTTNEVGDSPMAAALLCRLPRCHHQALDHRQRCSLPLQTIRPRLPDPGYQAHLYTARPSALSRLVCVNGLTGASGPTVKSALLGCPHSCRTTTPEGRTRPWATSLQHPDLP